MINDMRNPGFFSGQADQTGSAGWGQEILDPAPLIVS
jgi:hypothetical protein